MLRNRFAVLLVAMLFASAIAPALAASQVRLTGTYVRYVAVGADGTFICNGGTCAGQSMQYAEATTDTPTCDLYYPGSPVETFTVELTPAGTTAPLLFTNSGGIAGVTTLSGPTVTGRQITWSGRAVSGTANVRLDQVVELNMDDRHVRLMVTLRNDGTTALTNVYYLRNGDPDHGSCDIGFDFATVNDVRRQPPTDESALTTARGGDGTTSARSIVLGIGSHDPRARVHNGGFSNTDASGEWTSPEDGMSTSGDIGVDIVFREPMLAPGASTVFEILYVWGLSETVVTTRFDELGFPMAPCMGVAEGGACTTSMGATGVCRGGRCCTGCWDGTRCRAGSSTATCGRGGAACADCADTLFCTFDECAAGVCMSAVSPVVCDDDLSCTLDVCDEATDTCTHPPAASCTIGGECVGEGTANPTYPCLVCDPSRSMTDWSPSAAGTECAAPRCAGGRVVQSACDAAGSCVASGTPCPTGACLDATSCEPECEPGSCPAGEWCSATTGRCEAQLDLGIDCDEPASCASGSCADGVCCDDVCDGLCEACLEGARRGTCEPVLAETDPEDECPATQCDGAGACSPLPDAGLPPPDGGGAVDAGAMVDAGGAMVDAGSIPRPRDAGGCCSVPGGRTVRRELLGALGLVLFGLVLSRRRRRRG